jgi:hypothetical protein
VVAYKENSVMSCVFMHAFWNVIAESNILRVIVSANQYDPNAIFTYRLEPASTLLSGGFFGISASIFAVVAFLSPLCLLFLRRRNSVRAS